MTSARMAPANLQNLTDEQLYSLRIATRAIKHVLEAKPVRVSQEDEMLSIARANLRNLTREVNRRIAEAQMKLF